MDEEHKIAIRNFLQHQKLAVIATSNASLQTPESALIAFAEDENLCLHFQTGRHASKACHLQAAVYHEKYQRPRNILTIQAPSFSK